MGLKSFLAVFGTVFLAELGEKNTAGNTVKLRGERRLHLDRCMDRSAGIRLVWRDS